MLLKKLPDHFKMLFDRFPEEEQLVRRVLGAAAHRSPPHPRSRRTNFPEQENQVLDKQSVD